MQSKTPGKDLIVDQKTIARDVGFFLVFFAAAAAAGVVELPLFMRIGLATVLVASYAYYVRRTLHSGGASGRRRLPGPSSPRRSSRWCSS
jgi:hypothetical protein